MQSAASLILTNCFLSRRALKRRCSATMRLRTSVWRTACSRWRSASRKNTWGEGPRWSECRVTHTHTHSLSLSLFQIAGQIHGHKYVRYDPLIIYTSPRRRGPLQHDSFIPTKTKYGPPSSLHPFTPEGGCFQEIRVHPQHSPFPLV